ncbi:MAG: Type 1 glutamine amidotransferase-like domain-containing protein [bacterium]|nr:Type 1 glutamine amidotransferase-like domain-containing protein [bacterium]
MTKYILHGGSSNVANPDTDSFFREMTQETVGQTRVLLNYFSRPDDKIAECAEQDKKRFLEHSENKDLIFEIAKPESLAEQLKRADVMYMRGGTTKKLVDAMSLTPNLEALFEDKIIAGSSAGVYVLAKYYWENDTDELGEGLGIFNVKAFCHYTNENKAKVEKLLGHGENLPLLTIPDYKWLVFFK